MYWMDLAEYSYKNGFEKGRLAGIKETLNSLIDFITKETEELEDLTQSSQDFYWGEAAALSRVLEFVNEKQDKLAEESIINKVEV